jgi:hypothetical protein
LALFSCHGTISAAEKKATTLITVILNSVEEKKTNQLRFLPDFFFSGFKKKEENKTKINRHNDSVFKQIGGIGRASDWAGWTQNWSAFIECLKENQSDQLASSRS